VRFDKRARAWVETAVAATVVHSQQVDGGVASVIDRVTVVDDEGRRRRLILRRVPPRPGVTGHDPTAEITGETTALRRLHPSRLTPVLLAADPQGVHCGVPASLQSVLPGHPVVAPKEAFGWARSLAGSVLELADLGVGCDDLNPFVPWTTAEPRPPSWSSSPSSWELVIGALDRRLPPAGPPQFVHRDFHPGNILFSDGNVSGIVDWVHACRGPLEVDVSRCRVEIALLAGVAAADGFLEACGSAVAAYHPLWDALVALELAPCLDELLAFNAIGASLTIPGLQVTLDRIVQHAAAAC